MDVPLLIAEIHKRPALWDVVHEEHRDRQSVPKLWQEVAEMVGVDVDQCKRKWKNLRDAYRAEIRRSERRIERDKLMGDYDPNTNYNSKWVYFPLMDFIGDNCLRKRCVCFKNENANNNTNNQRQNQEYDNDDDDDDVDNDVVINDADADEERNYNNSEYNENMNSACDIKSEPSHNNNMDRNVRNFHDNTNAKQRAQEDEEEEAANDMLFEEFQNIATPQAARRLSACLSLNKSLQQNTMQEQQQQHQNIPPSSSTANNKANTNNNCSKCSQRTVDQVHFLEDLGREEQKLIKSTRQDMTRSNNLDHIGDSDYNFLVSFLPQMKKMTELQNLQFRARMCDMVLNIFSPPPTTTTTTVDNLRAVRSQNACNVSNSNERQQSMEVGSERSGGACGENSGNVVNSGFFD